MFTREKFEFVVEDDDRNRLHSVREVMPRERAVQYATDWGKEFDSRHQIVVWALGGDADLVAKIRCTKAVAWSDLPGRQRRLYDLVEQQAGADGSDCRDVLIRIDALAKDKAAVADAFGGPGAGDEFRREHVSKRGECSACDQPGFYFDGVRDPYWVHVDASKRGPHQFAPRSSRTRLVFESTDTRTFRRDGRYRAS